MKRTLLNYAVILSLSLAVVACTDVPPSVGAQRNSNDTRVFQIAEKGTPGVSQSHWLLTLTMSTSGIQEMEALSIVGNLPEEFEPETHSWKISVTGRSGDTLYEKQIPQQNLVRGEFSDIDGEGNEVVSGGRFVLPLTTVCLRVPKFSQAETLFLFSLRSSLESADPRRDLGAAGDWVELGRYAFPQ